ncbi:MAG: TonB-dependent receptor [Alphaproteobacteria bacterium]
MLRRLPVAAFILPFLAASAAAADELETVVVTASRVPIAANQSGSALTVIEGVDLEAQQIQTVFDALREVPGVAVNRSGALGSFSQIRIRGAEANHALVLIDGMEANDPGGQDEFNFAHLLTDGIERVEILRGPQSALWGADALAGVVNVITVMPREGIYAKARAEAGSFGTREVAGLLNIGSDRTAAVIGGAYLDSDGINISRAGREKDGYENASLNGRAIVYVADSVELAMSLRHVDSTTDFDSGFPLPVDSPDFTEADQSYGRAQVKATILDGALELLAGASFMRTDSANFSSATFDFHNIEKINRVKAGKDKYDVQANVFWTGAVLGFKLDQRLTVLGEAERKTFHQRVKDFPLADQDQAASDHAVAGEYWFAFGNAAFVSLGARHDWNEYFADSTTWRASLSVPLRAWDARLHASGGTGVKNPDFFELFGFVPSAFTGNADLKPEESLGFDLGLEKRLFNDAFTFDLTVYMADLEHEIFTDFSVFPATARNAKGKSQRSGMEVSAIADLANGVMLNAAYTYAASSENGAQELRRPHHIGFLDMEYRFDEGRGLLNLGVAFHGAQKDTDFTTFRTVTLKSYTLVHGAGSYEIVPGVLFTARIENAFDQKYEEVLGYRTAGFGAYAGLRIMLGDSEESR